MITPPEFLALLHDARNRFSTVRVVATNVHNFRLAEKAMDRWTQTHGGPRGGKVMLKGRHPVESPPEIQERTFKLWWDNAGSRFRIESATRHGSQSIVTTRIEDGATWWTYSDQGEAITNAGDPGDQRAGGSHELEWMFDPAFLIPELDFDQPLPTQWANRSGYLVKAHPRTNAAHHGGPHVLGADAVELIVDTERGTILRRSSFIDGELFMDDQVTEIAFDEPIDPEVFVFQPPKGMRVRSTKELHRRSPGRLRRWRLRRRAWSVTRFP